MHWQILNILWAEMHKIQVTFFLSLYDELLFSFFVVALLMQIGYAFACTIHCWNSFLKTRCGFQNIFSRVQKKAASALYFYTVCQSSDCCFFWLLKMIFAVFLIIAFAVGIFSYPNSRVQCAHYSLSSVAL